ncbi:FtsK/SpoIIIE domain-containing protein [Arthrobacter sp. Hz1]
MLLHLTLVWAPGLPVGPGRPAVELVVDTSLVSSPLELIDTLQSDYGPGQYTVAGGPLDSLTFGVAPLVNGSVIVAGGTRPAGHQRAASRFLGLTFVVCSGPDAGQLTALRRGTYSLGRSGTDIVLDDPEVSKIHAFLTVETNSVTLLDNTSANGTWVDGSRINAARISFLSSIQVGGSRCRVALLEQPSPAGPVLHLTDPLEVARPTPPLATPPMLAAALFPLALGIGLALTTGTWGYLGFSLLSAGVGLAPLVTRRRARRDFTAAVAHASEEDRRRRVRAVHDAGSRALAAFAPLIVDPIDRSEEVGPPSYLRLGEGAQPAHLVLKPPDPTWTRPLLNAVPVIIEIGTRSTRFQPPEVCVSGSGAQVLGLARSLLLQLSEAPGGAVCVGSPGEVPAEARFLPGVILAGTVAALGGPSRAAGPVAILLFGSFAEVTLPLTGSTGVFRFGCRPAGELPPDPGEVRLGVDLRRGRAELRGAGQQLSFRPDLVSTRSFSRIARALGGRSVPSAGVGDSGNDTGSPVLVGRVSLTQLVPSTPELVMRAWARPDPGLRAPIGRGLNGTLLFDLVSDGPHLVIAGTTGSGKSELLRTLILSIALHHGPTEVNFLLIDFKGGSALRPLTDLPHSVGLLTDLSSAAVTRALVSLLAEVRRRERLFAAHLVSDIVEWRAAQTQVLPRLVVVIDEFRMLVDDVPDAARDLIRIATLGRSLGIHLVMATQRPQGALGPDIRANVTASIALRVGSALESHDIIGSAAAAAIPVDAPGRAFLRLGTGPPTAFQVASPYPEKKDVGMDAGVVDLAAHLSRQAPSAGRVAGHSNPMDGTWMVEQLAAVAAHAAARELTEPLHYPVLPPLPETLPPPESAVCPSGTVRLGLLDLPEEQSQRPLLWCPQEHSHLALIGHPAGGTPDALVYLVDQLVRRLPDQHLYLLDGDGSLSWAAAAPQVGAYVGAHELKRAARVLARLNEHIAVRLSDGQDHGNRSRAGPAVTVVISGWGRWVGSLRTSRWAWAEGLAHDLARDGAPAGTTLLISGARELTTGQVFPLLPNRLYFPLGAGHELLLTWPRLPPLEALPGRCLAHGPIGRAAGAVGQVALGRDEASGPSPVSVMRPARSPFRVLPLPAVVSGSDVAGAATRGPPLRVPIGVGGDELGVVFLELSMRSVFLVIGGPGSGRTTLIGRIAAAAPIGMVCLRPGPGANPDAYWKDLGGAGSVGVPPADSVLLVDDADQLSVEAQRYLNELFTAGHRLVLTALASPSIQTKVPLAAHARSARTGMVLAPHQPTDGEFFGVRLDCDALPHPGRGFLIHAGEPLELQVAVGV